MRTAIIGLGNIGSRLAKNLINGGVKVIVADHKLDKAQKLAAELGSNAIPLSLAEAIGAADVVILAVYFDAMKELLATHRNAFAGKIIVDPSNPIGPDGNGGFKKTIPADQSSGMILSRLVPNDAELVKAFGTLKAESLGSAANLSPDRAVLFYATDFPEAGRAVAKLITASGFTPVIVGGIDQSIRIEVGGALHEMGKLGRVVSLKEAQTLV